MQAHLRFYAVALLLIGSLQARANVCGSDLQNFNPTSSNLNFVTVQSSNTLEPCLVNVGVFADYAINTLTYARNVGGLLVEGDKVKNSLLGLQFSAGMGITSAWDFGLNLPFTVAQTVDDAKGVTAFTKSGLNEVRLNTKYRFYGEPAEGIAFIFSLSQNTIQNNPFSGIDSGPSAVLELAGDTKWGTNWSGALNLGYKRRLAGTQVPGQPFVPFKDQYLYSGALGYMFNGMKSKMIIELYSALPAVKVDQQTNKNLNSSEINLGIKHRYGARSTVHAGLGKEVFDSFGAPDLRVYAGVTWLLGPICNINAKEKDPLFPRIEEQVDPTYGDPLPAINHPYDPIPFDEQEEPLPEPIERSVSPTTPDIYRFDVGVLFETDSAVVRKRYRNLLMRFARKINGVGFRYLVVSGHTDSVGRDEYNKALSQRRVNSVKSVLIDGNGIVEDKVQTEAWGEERPIAPNDTPAGRTKNRRVEIAVWK